MKRKIKKNKESKLYICLNQAAISKDGKLVNPSNMEQQVLKDSNRTDPSNMLSSIREEDTVMKIEQNRVIGTLVNADIVELENSFFLMHIQTKLKIIIFLRKRGRWNCIRYQLQRKNPLSIEKVPKSVQSFGKLW